MTYKWYYSFKDAMESRYENPKTDEITVIYGGDGWCLADVTTSTPNIYLSLHTFFKTLEGIPELERWKTRILKSVHKNVYFDSDIKLSNGDINTNPTFSWGVLKNGNHVAITLIFKL